MNCEWMKIFFLTASQLNTFTTGIARRNGERAESL